MVTDFFTASFGPAQGATGSIESRLRGSSHINPNLKMDYCYCGHSEGPPEAYRHSAD